MHTMIFLFLLAGICHEMQPSIAEEVNSSLHHISERATNVSCESVSECKIILPVVTASCSVCGLTNPGPRSFVIDGDVVQPQNRYPWMVTISERGVMLCGGFIISHSWILTAGHCVHDLRRPMLPEDVEIRFLSPTGSVTSPNATAYPIESFVIHPKFVCCLKPEFDIGVIKLRNRIPCGEYRNPICLPPAATARLPEETHLTIMGWGEFDKDKTDISELLLSAEVSVVHHRECQRRPDNVDVLCIKSKRQGQTACVGDSGGPAVIQRNKKYFAMGVASFHLHPHLGRCPLGTAFGYIRVAAAMDWITNITGIKPERFE